MQPSTHESIRRIAQSTNTRLDFFQRFLPILLDQTEAILAVAWDGSENPCRPLCRSEASAGGLSKPTLQIGLSEVQHGELLQQAITQGRCLTILPQPSVKHEAGEKQAAAVLLIAPLRRGEVADVIELFVPAGLTDERYNQQAANLMSLCQLASKHAAAFAVEAHQDKSYRDARANDSENENSNHAPAKRISPSQLDEYVHQLHRSLDLTETVRQVANEARRILDCDRVTVIRSHGRRQQIVAVSGQPSVNRRSNNVLTLQTLAGRILPTRQPFWFPAESELPGEIQQPLDEYLNLAGSRSLIVVPIFDQPQPLLEPPKPVPFHPRVIGGIVIEQFSNQWVREDVDQAVEIVTRHAADAFRNAHRHRQLFLYPLWKWLGKSKVVVAARNITKTAAATAGLLLASLLLAFYPADFKVACEGVIVPANRSKVFAQVDGVVAEIAVSHGSLVAAGDTLLTLSNVELQSEAEVLTGRIKELVEEIKTTETLLLTLRSEDDADIGQQSLNAQKAELRSYQRQLELINETVERLRVVSPRAGQVVTWNLEDRFRLRPVSRGEVLMEVVDTGGEWQLELDLPDRDIGHVRQALRLAEAKEATTTQSVAAKQNQPAGLPVEFILAAAPEHVRYGRVIEIASTTEVSPDKGQTVRVKVAIAREDLDIEQAQSGVSANIVCGRTSLGYALLHGVGEFVQKQWFRLF